MRMKRVTSIVAALVMIFSLMAGIGFAPSAAAKVTSELPKTTGLFVADWYNMSWDDELRKNVVITSKDQYGNTVPVDVQDQVIPYRDCENPEYLTKGIEEGWGFGMPPVDTFWFDYVDGNKVTHVPASKLKVTHLDGSACNDVTVKASDRDSRLVDVEAKVMEPVMIKYTGGKKNNKMILMPNLVPSFYTTEKRSVEGYIRDEVKVVKGKKKDIYVHLSDDMWESGRYKVDPANALSVSYWDREKEDNVNLEGAAAAEYATVSVISDKDPHDMSFKVTLTGKAPSNNWLNVNFQFSEYDAEEGEDKATVRGVGIGVSFIEGNVFESAYQDAFGIKNGNLYVVDEYAFDKNNNVFTTFGQPLYVAFRYTDADGNQKYVTDVKDLSFYQHTWDEKTQTEGIGEKLPDSVLNAVKITQPDASSPVLKVVVPKNDAIDYIEAVVGYKDLKPDVNQKVFLRVNRWVSEGFFSDSKVNADNYLGDLTTDGTKDETLYFGINGGDWLKSAKYKYTKIVDESGNDVGKKVKAKSVTMTNAENKDFAFGQKLTVPAGTLTGSSFLTVVYDCENNDGETWTRSERLFIRVKAPKKGTKFTFGGATYTVTGKNTAVFAKVKASAKSVTIPARVGAFKINGIGKFAMDGCKKLKKIVVKTSDIKLVGTLAFRGVPASAVATVPKAKKAAYSKLFKKQGFKGKVK